MSSLVRSQTTFSYQLPAHGPPLVVADLQGTRHAISLDEISRQSTNQTQQNFASAFDLSRIYARGSPPLKRVWSSFRPYFARKNGWQANSVPAHVFVIQPDACFPARDVSRKVDVPCRHRLSARTLH